MTAKRSSKNGSTTTANRRLGTYIKIDSDTLQEYDMYAYVVSRNDASIKAARRFTFKVALLQTE